MNELRKLFYLLLIIPFLFVQTGCSDDDDDPVTTTKYAIAGQVMNFDGDGLEGISVTLSGTTDATDATDADGNYEFTELETGDYTVTVTSTEYEFVESTISFTGITEDKAADFNVKINEAEVLVQYLEANGNPINNFAAMTKADVVNTAVLTGDANTSIIDIRSADDFAAGHISGAVNVSSTEVLTYYEANNLSGKDLVAIVCYSGQTAGWVTGLMHTIGYTNVKDMKYGMSSWTATTSGPWIGGISNARASELVLTVTAKAAAGDLPTITTGKTNALDILRARVETVFAEGFGAVKMTNAAAFDTPANYYIVNYWSETDYSWGHIPGAIQYTPKVDLDFDTNLKTLPTDKTIAVYCYTGQTSAHVAAYLKVLGYDAKTILYGVNGMAHDTMPGTVFQADTDVHDYALVQ